jgi:tetraacyldisaccharide 4'-kinase
MRRRIEGIWYGGEGAALTPLLAPAAALYATGHALRRALYGAGVVRGEDAGVPCISIGNIVVGGTGKTPMTAWLAGELLQRGFRPAVVSRGYGGTTMRPARVPAGHAPEAGRTFGDEPVLLARALPQLPVVVARNRCEAASLAVRDFGADVIVADDAFQHWRLRRDLDIVLIDARRWFGNGRLLPWGPLREPPEALQRAGVVILTRCGNADLSGRIDELQHIAPAAKVASADIVPGRWRVRGREGEAEAPQGPVYAFCGIADPRPFLKAAGAGRPLAGQRCFDDHHPFSGRDMEDLRRDIGKSGAAAAVTTAKDDARLEDWDAGVPLYILDVEIRFRTGEELVGKLVESVARGRGQ